MKIGRIAKAKLWKGSCSGATLESWNPTSCNQHVESLLRKEICDGETLESWSASCIPQLACKNPVAEIEFRKQNCGDEILEPSLAES